MSDIGISRQPPKQWPSIIAPMKHRFLLHSLNHTILVVDITQIGTTMEINPSTGNTKLVPALRFANWKETEQFFRAKEASEDCIESTHAMLNKSGMAVMTVV